MRKKIVWLAVSCLIALSLLMVACAPAAVEEKEAAPVEEEEEVAPTPAPSPSSKPSRSPLDIGETMYSHGFAFTPVEVGYSEILINGPFVGNTFQAFKPIEGYKFFYLNMVIQNQGIERAKPPMYSGHAEFKVKVDKGYIYQEINQIASLSWADEKRCIGSADPEQRLKYPGSNRLVFELNPEEQEELVVVFEIPENTVPIEVSFRLFAAPEFASEYGVETVIIPIEAVSKKQEPGLSEIEPSPTTSPTPSPTMGELKVHFIDVGQGDSILIDYGSYEMLIDGGRGSDCVAYIPSYVDGSLEVMVATHPDADHIGGLDDVLDAFVVEHIWLNGDTATTQTYTSFMAAVNAEGAQVHQAHRGDQISLSTLTFNILHPALPLSSDRNENSIVLVLSFGQVDFLFTGDVESAAEASMVSAGLIDDIDILKVSHHGSKYCSTANFLAAARPEIAIYSAGASNPYGHPTPETIRRLHDIEATIYGTGVHGTITVTTGGTTYDVQPTNNVLPVVPVDTSDVTHDLTVSVNGQGTTSPSPGLHTYDEDTQVTITALPASGWRFDHWGGDVTGDSLGVVIIMDANKSVIACFEEVTAVGSNVQITRIFYDGSVPRVESDEYVEIKNLGDGPQDLAGWVLKDIDDGYPSFTFPSFILGPGESIRVYTNETHPKYGGFSFSYGKAIWNNEDHDTAALYNAQGEEISRRSY